jgi:hypothetical protein
MELGSNKPPSNEGQGFDRIYQGVSQKVAFSGTSAQSTAFGNRTSIIRLIADHPCHILIGKTTDNSGAGPTAVNDGTNMYIPANVETYVGVPSGGIGQLAVKEDGSTAGTLYITEGL